VIVDAVEDFGQPGLRIVAVHLGCLDKGHRPGQRFATAVGACKKSVFSPDADRAHDALGRVVVDADAGISKEELE
jgi:hypothetical protein